MFVTVFSTPLSQSGNISTHSISLNLSYGISHSSNLTGMANTSPSGNSSKVSITFLNSCTYPLLLTELEENKATKYLLFLMAILISIQCLGCHARPDVILWNSRMSEIVFQGMDRNLFLII